MAVKEVAAGGVVIGGGGAGVGYAVYRNSIEKMEDAVYKEAISKTSDKNIGVPITKLQTSEQNDWWTKAFYRYFIEIDTTEEISGAGTKEDREKGRPSDEKKEAFKNKCIELLGKEKFSSEDADYKNAQKWCVTYKTVKEQLEESKRTLKAGTESDWETKYGSATQTTPSPSFTFKASLEKFKGVSSKNGDSEKKKDAMHFWCTLAMDASKDSIKAEVNSYCAFNSAN